VWRQPILVAAIGFSPDRLFAPIAMISYHRAVCPLVDATPHQRRS
jgi:hypothetical protein